MAKLSPVNADLRLREYRSVDGSTPWIVKAYEVNLSMEDIIERYEVTAVKSY